MRQVILFVHIVFFPVLLFAQQSDSSLTVKDSGNKRDSSLVQLSDSLPLLIDSSLMRKNDLIEFASPYTVAFNKILESNQFLNTSTKPVAWVIQEKKRIPKDRLFYLIAIIVSLLAFLRFVYTRYFNNLFRFFLMLRYDKAS